MIKIESITENPRQTMYIRLEDGSSFTLNLFYSENQQGWFYDVVYNEFVLYGRRIVTSLNLLRAFRGFIPFGINIGTEDKYEPVYIDDFKTGRSKMNILNEEEVQVIEDLINA